MDSDWILIYKMKQGNEEAWDQFIRKYYADILRYCYFHCQDTSCAEDLTQEVFLKFFAALAGYQHMGKAKHYLYVIAGNLCKDTFSGKQKLLLASAMETGYDPVSEMDDRLLLEAAIRRLPEPLRDVVFLYYYQGLKLTEISAVLKIGLPLVKYRLKRAKDLLRKEIDYGNA